MKYISRISTLSVTAVIIALMLVCALFLSSCSQTALDAQAAQSQAVASNPAARPSQNSSLSPSVDEQAPSTPTASAGVSAPAAIGSKSTPVDLSGKPLYDYILQPHEVSAKLFESGYEGPVTPLIESNIIYSRLLMYGFTGGYVRSYGSEWNTQVKDYNLRFYEEVYQFPSAQEAKATFLDLNASLFTGSMDKLDDVFNYQFDPQQSLRIQDIRRFSDDFKKVTGLYLKGSQLVHFEYLYPVAEMGANGWKEVNTQIQHRIDSPLSLDSDPGMTFLANMEKNYLYLNSTTNFTVRINNISYAPSSDGAGILNLLVFTVTNTNNYPFYPVISYYIQQTDFSKESSFSIAGQAFAKWTMYDYQFLDAGESRSYFFAEPTSIHFDTNGSAVMRLEILDNARGDSPYLLSRNEFTVDMNKYKTK